MMSNNKELEIDLSTLFKVIKKHIIPIVLVTVLFGVGAFFGTKYFVEKQYKASAMIIVNNRSGESSGFNSGEITAAQDLADVYSIIIKSDTVINEVIDKLKLDMTYEQLKNSITVSPVNATQVIEISMIGNDASLCQVVVEEVVNVSKPVISDIVGNETAQDDKDDKNKNKDKDKNSSVKDISKASIANNGNPVGPNAKKNATVSALVGFVLVMAVIIFKEFFNKRFKSDADVIAVLNLPVMGIIPAVEGKEFSK